MEKISGSSTLSTWCMLDGSCGGVNSWRVTSPIGIHNLILKLQIGSSRIYFYPIRWKGGGECIFIEGLWRRCRESFGVLQLGTTQHSFFPRIGVGEAFDLRVLRVLWTSVEPMTARSEEIAEKGTPWAYFLFCAVTAATVWHGVDYTNLLCNSEKKNTQEGGGSRLSCAGYPSWWVCP